ERGVRRIVDRGAVVARQAGHPGVPESTAGHVAHDVEHRANNVGVLAQHQRFGHRQARVEQRARDAVFAIDGMRRREQHACRLAAQDQLAGIGFEQEGRVRLPALELADSDVAGEAWNGAAQVARKLVLIELAARGHGDGGADLCGGRAHAAILAVRYLSSSIRASWRSWTSSGPSVRRTMRVLAHNSASPKSSETPPPPCAWIASSTIRCAMRGAAILIIAISARAALLPTVSIMCAALRQSSRAISISHRARAIRSSHTECSAIDLPKAWRSTSRQHIFSSATSIVAMLRIVWWMRPGPSRPCAISNPRPSPSSRFSAGTR